ncbi:MAG TPA: type II toxin-antitoxin system HicA family toxin [Thermoanaerobaculia bacterium]|nr:type II toxin-antitoxin system HicA family toxin [Thermoanaerobaculia bacterium]
MTRIGPVSRRELIRRLRQLGFEGPFTGGRHEFMSRKDVRLVIPNPHRQDIRADLLTRILRQAGISREEWQSAD